MLEYLVIFGRGGVILWTFGQLLNVKGNATNSLIRTCLLEDRGGEGSYTYRPPTGSQYTLKWKFHNVRPASEVGMYTSELMALSVLDVCEPYPCAALSHDSL